MPPSNPGKRLRPKATKEVSVPTVSAILSDGSLVEMLHQPEEHRTSFCISRAGEIRFVESVTDNGRRLVPYSPHNNLLKNEVILFPSEPMDYGSEPELMREIADFIHRYVDISSVFEELASYYILFSWVYDAFNELPYLRVRGDTGSGKTRCLLTIGSLCYKPIFASGASTVSPLFRMIDLFRGTLVVDEGDFRFSDEKAEITKILNNGNARGFPVLRSESVNGREFDPRAYSVFGPKLIATRGYFEDRALESRCLTEEMGSRRLRTEIPLNLDDEWKRRARTLRNKLLTFRFRNYNMHDKIDPAFVDRSIEPRLAQVFGPLLTVIKDPEARRTLIRVAREYHQAMVEDRGLDVEAQVLEVLRDAIGGTPSGQASMRDIAGLFAARHGDDYDRKVTPKWIGNIIRKKLQLRTEKSHGVFVLSASETAKLARLYEKYGIAPTPVMLDNKKDAILNNPRCGDVGDFGDLQ